MRKIHKTMIFNEIDGFILHLDATKSLAMFPGGLLEIDPSIGISSASFADRQLSQDLPQPHGIPSDVIAFVKLKKEKKVTEVLFQRMISGSEVRRSLFS